MYLALSLQRLVEWLPPESTTQQKNSSRIKPSAGNNGYFICTVCHFRGNDAMPLCNRQVSSGLLFLCLALFGYHRLHSPRISDSACPCNPFPLAWEDGRSWTCRTISNRMMIPP